MKLTAKKLLAAGFKKFLGGGCHPYSELYQFRVRDDKGTRYFIDCMRWIHEDGRDDSWEIDINYNDGCMFHPTATMRIKLWPVNGWSVFDITKAASELWDRLAPNYYERNQDE